MVQLSGVLRRFRKPSKFIDNLRIYVKGGSGGQGYPKFGGHGGQGGSVYIKADKFDSLKHVVKSNPKKRFIAENGKNSDRLSIMGAAGEDVEIPVPPGVMVKNDAGRILGEVNEVGEKVLLVKGGAGGGPKNGWKGQKGHAYSVKLDLKVIADIGLVGFPNAGKSTILSALSRASPKIASYPFTTIKPNLGVIWYEDHRQISMADLPGLIEGAHYNVGMGHSFLKHVERTKLLMFMIDIHGFQLSPKHPYRGPIETLLLLIKELELYKEELVHKPAIVALNKTDVPGKEGRVEELVQQVKNLQDHLDLIEEKLRPNRLIDFMDVVPISAKEHMNTDRLKTRLRDLLDYYADLEKEDELGKIQSRRDRENQRQLTEHFSGGHLT